MMCFWNFKYLKDYPKNDGGRVTLRGDKFIELSEMLKIAKVDILCLDETKLSSEIPTSRLHIDGYQYSPLRGDRPKKRLTHLQEVRLCMSEKVALVKEL